MKSLIVCQEFMKEIQVQITDEEYQILIGPASPAKDDLQQKVIDQATNDDYPDWMSTTVRDAETNDEIFDIG
jgi:hypothetical protein